MEKLGIDTNKGKPFIVEEIFDIAKVYGTKSIVVDEKGIVRVNTDEVLKIAKSSNPEAYKANATLQDKLAAVDIVDKYAVAIGRPIKHPDADLPDELIAAKHGRTTTKSAPEQKAEKAQKIGGGFMALDGSSKLKASDFGSLSATQLAVIKELDLDGWGLGRANGVVTPKEFEKATESRNGQAIAQALMDAGIRIDKAYVVEQPNAADATHAADKATKKK
jgi:hypothetical protein